MARLSPKSEVSVPSKRACKETEERKQARPSSFAWKFSQEKGYPFQTILLSSRGSFTPIPASFFWDPFGNARLSTRCSRSDGTQLKPNFFVCDSLMGKLFRK